MRRGERRRHGAGVYDALLGTMKNGRILGASRFQLEPIIRRTFDIPSMTRLSVRHPGRLERGATAAGDR
jgi:hypothetical protein